ncbi:TPA: FUSC family protein [Klebsiella aerogenes]|nr:FUSC family protein [Klebsiella aerogenes]
MTASLIIKKKPHNIIKFICDELRPYPGRYNAMLRYLVASLLTIIISVSLSVPQLSYSLLVVFFATQQNIVLTRIIFPLFILVNTAAVASAIILLKYTIDYPMLRLLSASVLLLILLYKMRSSQKWGFLFFAMAITITYSQSFVDQSANGELLLRNCMWTWVAGCYATLVAHLVNTILLPVEPVVQLKSELQRILTLINRALITTRSGGEFQNITLHDIQNSMLTLHKHLKFSMMRSDSYRQNKTKHLAEITAIERLYAAVRELSQLTPLKSSPVIHHHCGLLSRECLSLLTSIKENTTYHFDTSNVNIDLSLPTCLQEMYSTFISLSLIDHRKNITDNDKKENAVSKNNLDINYNYVKYGVKTLLSVAICYIFYTSVQWPGIHTSMLTCIIVAVPGLGASVQKSLLRIVGCIVGSLIALVCTLFILPHIDNITGLLLMAIPAITLSGWIAAGSERISYAGIQVMFAFSLAIFTHFYSSPDVTEIRDRLIGILLGIAVSTFIHGLIWPETEGRTLRNSIAGLISYYATRINNLIHEPNKDDVSWEKLDAVQKLLSQVALEPNWRNNDNENLVFYCQTLLGKLTELHVKCSQIELQLSNTDINNELYNVLSYTCKTLYNNLNNYSQGLVKEPVSTPLILNSDESDKLNELQHKLSALDFENNFVYIRLLELIAICRSIPSWPAEEK